MVNDLAQVNECNDDDENRPEKTLVDCKKDGEGNCGKEGEREGEWAGEHLKRIILKLMIVWSTQTPAEALAQVLPAQQADP